MLVLNLLLLVTIFTPDLASTEQAYQQYLHYQTVNHGKVSTQLATLWQHPELAGSPYKIMQPASGKKTYLRFIETKTVLPSHQPGWTAIEILTEDVDQLAQDLKTDSAKNNPFTIRGPPNWLNSKKNVRAMQVTGPANEMLYLTQVIDPGKQLLAKQTADSYVDQPFIMVAGTTELNAALTFYQDQLGLTPIGPFPYKIAVLSEQLDVSADTQYGVSLVKLSNHLTLEIDRYPDELKTAAKTFYNPIFSITMTGQQAGENLNNKPSLRLEEFPYNDRQTHLITGKAGERIEVVTEY